MRKSSWREMGEIENQLRNYRIGSQCIEERRQLRRRRSPINGEIRSHHIVVPQRFNQYIGDQHRKKSKKKVTRRHESERRFLLSKRDHMLSESLLEKQEKQRGNVCDQRARSSWHNPSPWKTAFHVVFLLLVPSIIGFSLLLLPLADAKDETKSTANFLVFVVFQVAYCFLSFIIQANMNHNSVPGVPRGITMLVLVPSLVCVTMYWIKDSGNNKIPVGRAVGPMLFIPILLLQYAIHAWNPRIWDRIENILPLWCWDGGKWSTRRGKRERQSSKMVEGSFVGDERNLNSNNNNNMEGDENSSNNSRMNSVWQKRWTATTMTVAGSIASSDSSVDHSIDNSDASSCDDHHHQDEKMVKMTTTSTILEVDEEKTPRDVEAGLKGEEKKREKEDDCCNSESDGEGGSYSEEEEEEEDLDEARIENALVEEGGNKTKCTSSSNGKLPLNYQEGGSSGKQQRQLSRGIGKKRRRPIISLLWDGFLGIFLHRLDEGRKFATLPWKERMICWILGVLLQVCVGIVFTFCEELNGLYEKVASSQMSEIDKLRNQALYYFGFQLFLMMMRKFACIVARAIENTGANPNCAFEHCCSFFISMFYYVFYRSLFDNITAWWIFAALQSLHTLFEVMFYPVRMSLFVFRIYYRTATWFSQKIPFYEFRYRNMSLERAHHVYIDYVCIEYGGRLLGFFSSAIGFMCASTWVQFGYNSKMFPNLVNHNTNFNAVILYLSLALICELITHIILSLLMRKWYKRGLLNPWFKMISSSHHRVFLLWAMAHVSTDVFLAKLTTNLAQ